MKSLHLKLVLAIVLVFTSVSVKARKPHIVVYLSDDHSMVDSSLYDEPAVPTPEMEKMAAEGMVLNHCYVASPSCGPSRAAFMTGLMPSRNGAEPNHTQPKKGFHSLILDIRAAGYKTASFGKVAHQKGKDTYGFDLVDRDVSHEVMKKGVLDFIASEPDGQPLAIFVGTSNPHTPWPMENPVAPDSVRIPPMFPDTMQTREHMAAYVQEVVDLDILLGELRAIADEKLGDDVLFIHSSDHGANWSFGKWNLYDYGIRVPFIATWPGKIKPGTKSDAMVSWVDLLPTVIDAAGGTVPADLDGASFLPVLMGKKKDHRDVIYTTHAGDCLRRKTGIVATNIYPSRSIRNREWKLIYNLNPEAAFTCWSDIYRKPGRAEYWNEWAELMKTDAKVKKQLDRYFKRPEIELYHVTEDPWEMKNLANNPEHAERIATMKKKLEAWMESQGDERLVCGPLRPLDQPETWHPDYFPNHPHTGLTVGK
ncbi:Arylsulfatase [Pontiella desulfatans]|uniref:Arylsulfatase n=1 Tax=Pontiella desulfatans TaxID=2750659 RepID=A0A6C2U3S2_PONDE|nr:sulfatase [Pontiella desulfatans]SPS73908.1 sulfatase S1_8 [Kiritimatiellales bacterium]VGO14016.1 Arylsulfatase [Pontiella desulfatans]